jgi:membrane protein implicated in regulation of membrane protease activity
MKREKKLHDVSLPFTVVFLVLLVLKLTGIIGSWSWWIILSPIWIPLLFLLVLSFVYCFLIWNIDRKQHRDRNKQ